ncbi:MAG: DUF2752 domain-containing protein [bacterium]|nr:DUF2752 domain-containing protein [bacterium]
MRWPLMKPGKARAAVIYAAAALLCLAAASVLYFFPPSQTAWYPKCPSWMLFGIYCPGCGTARALGCLVHGDIVGACRMNIVITLMSPILAWCLWEALRNIAEGRPFSALFENTRFWQVFLWGFVLFGVLRNIPVYPFTLLAPH